MHVTLDASLLPALPRLQRPARRGSSLPLTQLTPLFFILALQETSEEIRLQIVQFVALAVSKMDSALTARYSDELSAILCRSLEDGFHDIKKAACGCLVALAPVAGAPVLERHAEPLLTALVANLGHAHSRVRLASVQALDALVAAGVPGRLIESLVAPGVKAMPADRAPNVREAFFRAVAHWLGFAAGAGSGAAGQGEAAAAGSGAGAPASAAHAAVLLPLLLLGVTDGQASIAAEALQLVQGVGDAYCSSSGSGGGSGKGADGDAAEASAAVSKMEIDSSAGGDAEMADASSSGAGCSEADAAAAAAAVAATLGAPYTGRPTAGCRRMAQRLLPQLLPPAIKDLTEWTAALRSAAARSLHTTLVLSEGSATNHLPALLPALCAAVGDEDADIARTIVSCVHVIGSFVPARRWVPLIVDQLANAKLSASQRASALVVASGLLHAAGKAQPALGGEQIALLASTLTSEDVKGAADHPAVRLQLMAVVLNLVRWARAAVLPVAAQLYATLLQAYGFEKEAPAQAAIRDALGELAAACGLARCVGVDTRFHSTAFLWATP